jgi:hypothetical protein
MWLAASETRALRLRRALVAERDQVSGLLAAGSPNICCIELRCRCLAANTDRSIMRVRADRGAAGCLRVGRQDLIDQRRVPGAQRLIAALDGGLGFGPAFAD